MLFFPSLLLAHRAVAIAPRSRLQQRQEATPTSDPSSLTSATTTTDTPETLAPWTTIDEFGSASVVTPSVSSDSTEITTVGLKPTETASNTPEDQKDDGSNDDPVTGCNASKYEITGPGKTTPYVPFCAPRNGTEWWVGGHYYVTWNRNFWERNSTVVLTLNYVNYGGAGMVVDTWTTSNSLGFMALTPSKDWLINQTLLDSGISRELESQPLLFTISSSSSTSVHNAKTGPMVNLITRPKPNRAPSTERHPVSSRELTIALPLIAFFIIAMVAGLHYFMQQHRRTAGPMLIGGGRMRWALGRGNTGRRERRRRAQSSGVGGGYRDGAGETDSLTRDDELELSRVKEM
ncbi:hypothetical protein RUND412_007910 [Rhizina undulata]